MKEVLHFAFDPRHRAISALPGISLSEIPPEAPVTSAPEAAARVHPSPTRRPLPASGLRAATILTIISAIILGVSTWELLRGSLSTTLAELSAAVALAAFGFTIYGLLRMILAVVESVGERRRQTREFSERRLVERPETPGNPEKPV